MGKWKDKALKVSIVAVVVLLALLFLVLRGRSRSGWNGLPLRNRDEFRMELAIEKIRDIEMLTSAEYVGKAVKVGHKPRALGRRQDQICIVAKGRVRAGYDFSRDSISVIIEDNVATVILPQPRVFDVTVNPSDWRVYDQVGGWTDKEIRPLLTDCRRRLYQDAVGSGILDRAKKSAQDQISVVLASLGFDEVRFATTVLPLPVPEAGL